MWKAATSRYILLVIANNVPHCQKCSRRTVINFRVEPEEAWKAVTLNRWRDICPSCFDAEAEKAGVRFTFTDVGATAWSDRPLPRNPHKRKR